MISVEVSESYVTKKKNLNFSACCPNMDPQLEGHSFSKVILSGESYSHKLMMLNRMSLHLEYLKFEYKKIFFRNYIAVYWYKKQDLCVWGPGHLSNQDAIVKEAQGEVLIWTRETGVICACMMNRKGRRNS